MAFEKRKNRSDKYQWKLLESVFSHEMLDAFSTDDSIYSKLNPFAYDEEILELQDKLNERFWFLVDNKLTDRQAEVIKLYAKENLTQMEIAHKLNVNQSSITKSLNGNVDYKNGKRNYGGAIRKIMNIVHEDEESLEIMRQIMALRDSDW